MARAHDRLFTLRMTHVELARWRYQAALCGMSVSAWVREACLRASRASGPDQPPQPPTQPALPIGGELGPNDQHAAPEGP